MSWSSHVPAVRRAKWRISNERLAAPQRHVSLRGQVRQLATMSRVERVHKSSDYGSCAALTIAISAVSSASGGITPGTPRSPYAR
jgi:hypothetical protein